MSHDPTRTSDEDLAVQTVSEPIHEILKRAQEEAAAAKRRKSPKAMAYRPTQRQPLARLTILDDGQREEGEVVRIRTTQLTIGRDQGDIKIPFDGDISNQHAELRCHLQKDKFRWYLFDLGSTNGTFLRGYRATLSSDLELMIGSRRYQFRLPQQQPAGEQTQALQTHAYSAPARTLVENYLPSLTELGVEDGRAKTLALTGREVTLGSDKSCHLCLSNDPFLSPTHARIYLDERGRWMIEDKKSLNGVWIRIKRMPLDQKAEFQLGQQRFCFEPTIL